MFKFLFTNLGSYHVCMCAKSLQLYPTLCDPIDYSPLGSSVHGIPQARILEWVAISFSSRSSGPLNPGLLHCRQILYWDTREAYIHAYNTHIQVFSFLKAWCKGSVKENSDKECLGLTFPKCFTFRGKIGLHLSIKDTELL